jgi:hypothetical protein
MVVVAAVASGTLEATDGATETGGLVVVGAPTGVVATGAHAAARRTATTRKGFALTDLPPPGTVLRPPTSSNADGSAPPPDSQPILGMAASTIPWL